MGCESAGVMEPSKIEAVGGVKVVKKNSIRVKSD